MKDTTSIMIVGVGGQGTLLASRILGNLLVDCGYDVKVSEIHGMAQRGGSVVTYVRYGNKVHSPIIDECGADYILAFELLEAYRWMPYIKKDGAYIVNTQKIEPMPVITGAAKYPENIIGVMSGVIPRLTSLDALKTAVLCGNAKAVNLVLLGVLARKMDFDKNLWLKAIENTVPKKFLDVNIKAFEAGLNITA